MKEGENGRKHDLDHPSFWRKHFRHRRKNNVKEVCKYEVDYETPATVGKSLRRSIKKRIRQDKFDDILLERHHSIRRWRNKPSKSQISLSSKAGEKYTQDSQLILRKSSYNRQNLEASPVDNNIQLSHREDFSFSAAHETALKNATFETAEKTPNIYSSIRRNSLANSATIENVTETNGGSGDDDATNVLLELETNIHEDIVATIEDTELDLLYDRKENAKQINEENWETIENGKKNTQLRDFRYSLQKDRLNMDMLDLDYSYASEKEFSFGCTAMTDSNTSICTENAQSMATLSTATSESASNSINNSSSFEWYANNVMKKLESSVLSLWGMGAVKKGASNEELTAVPFPASKMEQQDDMRMLPVRHSSLASELHTPSFTSIPTKFSKNTAEVDSEIYGNHAKYFI